MISDFIPWDGGAGSLYSLESLRCKPLSFIRENQDINQNHRVKPVVLILSSTGLFKFHFRQTAMERSAADSQQFCSSGTVAAALFQGLFDQFEVVFLKGKASGGRGIPLSRRSRTFPKIRGQIVDSQLFCRGRHHHKFNRVPQFPDVARPGGVDKSFQKF